MDSKKLAETFLRVSKISNIAKQISCIDFYISTDSEGKIFISSGINSDDTFLIIDFSKIDIPEESKKTINSERICSLLNKSLEEAKFMILKEIQNSVSWEMNSSEISYNLEERRRIKNEKRIDIGNDVFEDDFIAVDDDD